MEALLALDLGNRWTGAALIVDGTPVGEIHADLGRRQGGQLPGMVVQLLERADVPLAAVRTLALACGPGYFTALRVGLAYGQALAYSLGASVLPVSSLEVVARSFARPGETVVPLIAASRKTVFSAAYRDGELLLPEEERTTGALKELVARERIDALWVAAEDERLAGQEHFGEILLAPRGLALTLAQIGWQRRGAAQSPLKTEAHYLREPGLGQEAKHLEVRGTWQKSSTKCS